MQIFPGRQIALARVGDREISTVELPRFPGDPVRFETCIFPDSAPSHVVAQYDSAETAESRHAWLVEHEQKHLVSKLQHMQKLS